MNAGEPRVARPADAGLVVSGLTDYEHGITAIDTEFVRARLDASHLIVENGRAAFVDTGTALALPLLLAALAAKGIAREAVDWVFLTHIHLDHAGGAGALMQALPNARLVVHPRGAAHMIAPARLIEATRQVYGDARYARLYGEIVPVAAERVVIADDGLDLILAGRRFQFVHTPGHALHHCAIIDREAGAIFSGDTFGVSYREFDVAGREFVIPATTPTQFDPEQLTASVGRIVALAPRAVYLTHYSRVTDIARLGRDLIADIAAYVDIAERHAGDADRGAGLREAVFAYHSARLDAHGFAPDPARRHALLDPDIELNSDGLIAWLDRRRA